MRYDIRQIIQRMKEATGSKNNSKLAEFLGTRPSIFAGWVERDRVPYDQCFQIYEETGVTVEYLITGEHPDIGAARAKFADVPKIQVPEDIFVDEYAETYTLGIEMSILAPGTQYDTESLQFLGKKMYRKLANNAAPIVRGTESMNSKQG